jgi:hypothetical protein
MEALFRDVQKKALQWRSKWLTSIRNMHPCPEWMLGNSLKGQCHQIFVSAVPIDG